MRAGWALWCILGLFVAGSGGFLVKMWRVTPDGFLPVFRVSMLDMVQSRMLHRRALEAAEAGDRRGSALAWRGAVANNPGNLEVLRGWVGAAAAADDATLRETGAPLSEALRLLQWGGTNLADVELTMRLMWRLEMVGDMVRLGEPFVGALGSEAAGWMARAYFDVADMASFDALWARHGAAFASDPELGLRREAWKAQWGPPSTAREGMDRLATAQGDPKTRRLAMAMARKLAVTRADVVEHERLLREEVADGTAGVREYVELWLLMAASGRREDAIRSATEVVPILECQTVKPTRMLAQALLTLGMVDQALELLESRRALQHRDLGLCLLRAEALRVRGRWEDLKDLALSLGSGAVPGVDATLAAQALRAIAEAKLKQMSLARATAEGLAGAPTGDPGLTIRLAEWLADAGLGGAAVALMRKAEPALNGSAAYWAQRTTAAGMANDLDDMLESSRRALELGRDDRRLRNNRAVALLLARRDPAEAVRLTFQNVTLFPGERPYQVNHALALLDNDRVLEARRILEGLAVAGMSSGQEANFHLAWVALLVREGRRAEATLRAGEVNRSQLLPVQEAWLDRMVAGVGKR